VIGAGACCVMRAAYLVSIPPILPIPPISGPMSHSLQRSSLLALALGCCAWACGPQYAGAGQGAVPYPAICQRTTNEFAAARFLKPSEVQTNDLAFTLAPLIMQEVKEPTASLPTPDRFGALSLTNGLPAVDRSLPTIYWHADTVRLKGAEHVRYSYIWCYSAGTAAQGESSLGLQGIRITLNTAGQPAIWEVLADDSGADVIYVSQNLEAAAQAEFGKALPGRRYAVERGLAEAPKAIVARVIDDGPVAMGPFVYLSGGSRVVTTLLCRCMSAQVRKIAATSNYDLAPFQSGAGVSLLTQVKALLNERTAFWPGDAASEVPLEKRLRLPTAFSGAAGKAPR
jgi:hypothetical protein